MFLCGCYVVDSFGFVVEMFFVVVLYVCSCVWLVFFLFEGLCVLRDVGGPCAEQVSPCVGVCVCVCVFARTDGREGVQQTSPVVTGRTKGCARRQCDGITMQTHVGVRHRSSGLEGLGPGRR